MGVIRRVDGGSGGEICPVKSGIAYQGITFTGQTTIYQTNDDGSHLAQGSYEEIPPPFPVIFARLDYTALDPFNTLVDNNFYGNKTRLTDTNGGQSYSNDIIVDNLTKRAYYRVEVTQVTWSAAIIGANASTQNGHSDWRIPTEDEFSSITQNKSGLTSWLGYAPFSLSSTRQWSSTTLFSNSLNAMVASSNSISSRTKTLTENYIMVRNHTF